MEKKHHNKICKEDGFFRTLKQGQFVITPNRMPIQVNYNTKEQKDSSREISSIIKIQKIYNL